MAEGAVPGDGEEVARGFLVRSRVEEDGPAATGAFHHGVDLEHASVEELEVLLGGNAEPRRCAQPRLEGGEQVQLGQGPGVLGEGDGRPPLGGVRCEVGGVGCRLVHVGTSKGRWRTHTLAKKGPRLGALNAFPAAASAVEGLARVPRSFEQLGDPPVDLQRVRTVDLDGLLVPGVPRVEQDVVGLRDQHRRNP